MRVPRSITAHPVALLVVLSTATFMSSLDLFIVNVGLHAIGEDVGRTSLADLSWILNAYAIVFAALLVPAGRLADRYGNRRLFLGGLALFTAASLGAALSGSLWLIVAWRGLQAAGAAALVPTSLGLILTAMPPERRRMSVQVWAVAGSLGATAGPALGGVLVDLSWRWIFLMNLPVGVAALAAGAVLAPNLRHRVDTRVPDLLGGLVLVVAVGAVVLALEEAPGWGWTSGATLTALAVGAVALAAFALRSARHPAPVVDPGMFRSRAFLWANVSMLVFSIAFGMAVLGMVLWLQQGWGWSPVATGLGIAPGPLMVSVGSLGLRRWTAGLPAGPVAAVGALLFGAGGVLVGLSIGPDASYVTHVLPGWLIGGLGVGLALPTLISAGAAGLPAHQTSTGSAIVQMSRQVGTALGVAVLVVVLGSAGATAGNLDHVSAAWLLVGALNVAAAAAALRMTARRAPVREPAPAA